LLLRVWHFTR